MFTRRVGFALLPLALVCATLPVLGDSTARIVRLSYLDGDVQIDRGTGHGFERAVLNMPVVQGAQLATRDGGTAEVEFEDGSTLRLTPATSVAFPKLSLRDDGTRVSSIELAQGTAYLEGTAKKDQFSINAGGPSLTLTHDAHLRVQRDPALMTLAVLKGEVSVQDPSGSVRVKKDETLTVNLKDPSQYELAKGVDPDSYDAWSQQRDQYRQTYASNHHNGYNPLYSYGWSDLNYFGSFNSFGNYGPLWQPWGVGPGWDPFADGAWMYYPGHGYMWVSGYPWGWMPYRYGTWTFVPGFGWGWSPGMMWNSWAAMPGIYGAPAGYVAPLPPPVHGVAGTAPGTVVVGAGPMTGVRTQSYARWMEYRSSAHIVGRSPSISPVPPPASSMRTTTTQKTVGSGAGTTATSPKRTTRSQQSRHGESKGSTAPRQATPPPAAPPRSEASPPPEMPRGSSEAGGWGRGSSGGSSAPRSEPRK